MIILKNISKYYDKLIAIDNIDLEINSSAITILIGPSGCGKSTLIRILTGLTNINGGTIGIEGEELSESNINVIRKKMGYVIQEGGLFPHLTAYDNVILMAKYLKWDRTKIEERVQYLYELTKLDESFLYKYPLQLSGGQKQRVSLMRALMLDPEILLLDEPLGALDPLIRFDLQNDLKDIFLKLKKTVIMVTHDLAEAVFFGDKIVLMKEGKIIQQGTSKELINQPKDAFVTKFINAQRSHIN